MQRTVSTEYYGDETRWFVGTVVNATPPAGLEGRVRIRIHGVHDPFTGNVKESDLPWAQVMLPLTEGSSSGYGRVPQVLPGAFVYGVFMDGKSSQTPLVIGSLSKQEFPTDVQVKASKDKALSVFKANYDPTRKQNDVSDELEDDNVPDANPNKRRSQAMKFFIDNGYSPRQSAGLVGCIEASSRFVTFDPDNPKSTYYGIVGWLRDSARYNNLFKFGGQFNKKDLITKYSIQLQFVLYELRTSFASTNARFLRTDIIEGPKGSVEIIAKKYFRNREIIPLATELAVKALEEALA